MKPSYPLDASSSTGIPPRDESDLRHAPRPYLGCGTMPMRVLIPFNFEVKPPTSVYASLPEIIGAFQLLCAQRGVPRIYQQKFELLSECLAGIS